MLREVCRVSKFIVLSDIPFSVSEELPDNCVEELFAVFDDVTIRADSVVPSLILGNVKLTVLANVLGVIVSAVSNSDIGCADVGEFSIVVC